MYRYGFFIGLLIFSIVIYRLWDGVYQDRLPMTTPGYYKGVVIDKVDYCGKYCRWELKIQWDHGWNDVINVSAMTYKGAAKGGVIVHQCIDVWPKYIKCPSEVYDPKIDDSYFFWVVLGGIINVIGWLLFIIASIMNFNKYRLKMKNKK